MASQALMKHQAPPPHAAAGAAAAAAPEADEGPESESAPGIKRRAGIACRRCRRMRSKCHHDKATPPCVACAEAGIGPGGCIFPVRGLPDLDRDYRHPRSRAEKGAKRDPTKVRREILDAPVVRLPQPASPYKTIKGADDWDSLPPLSEIVEAVEKFTSHYFQLGFIPKQMFLHRLCANHRSVSVFFLLSILSVSARLVPSLVERFGSAVNAAETFMARASAVALEELYKGPDLERCQAFYLLSIAQQGSGMKTKSAINMAVATRMAILMELHREETYVLVTPTKELIVRAESARRTLWMLHSQDNLHAGPKCPVSLTASDITALLPGSEEDFANAREPRSRAALEDTPPALASPHLVSDARRSLFATLIQTHHFWGAISRQALSYDKSLRPWDPDSNFAKMAAKLKDWESNLPPDHRWGDQFFEVYKHGRQELAYLTVTNTTRLCNIVIRKAYIHDIMSCDKTDLSLAQFWSRMSLELFQNVALLFEQIDTQHSNRSPEDGLGAQMSAFCIYTCGFLANYLCRYPTLCPDKSIAGAGPRMLQRCMDILSECKSIWPLASRWYDILENNAKVHKTGPTKEGSMSDSRDDIPHALHPLTPLAPKPAQAQVTPPTDEGSVPPPSAATDDPADHLPLPHAEAGLYLDPNLRLDVQQTITPPGQHQPLPQLQHAHQNPVPGLGADAVRHPNADGLGLLIQASSFSTHPHPHPPLAGLHGSPPGPAFLHGPSQEYYPQMGLASNDGYENELHYCVTDGVPTIQTWAGTTGLFY